MDKIARIRQKIKELRGLLEDHNYYLDNSEQALGYSAALDDIEKFLDTLSGKDARPCWEKVHTYTEELREGDMEKMLLDLSIGKGERKTKIALPDRAVDTLSEEPDNEDLNEEIKKEMVKLPFFIRGKDQIAFARHFAEWQAEKDARDMKEQTVEGEARVGYPFSKPFVDIEQSSAQWCNMMKKFMNGDKVRIVVLKAEED